MKNANRIGAKLITGYFLLLPLLVVYHSFHHHTLTTDYANHYTQLKTNCTLCDLYYEQIGIEEVVNLAAIDNPMSLIRLVFNDAMLSISQIHNLQRGPPGI